MEMQLSTDKIRESAVKLQEDFLQEYSESSEMDDRDIAHVQSDIEYVEKFVRHHRGRLENAFQHMVECLTWRKSFGVNDLKYEDIDVALWKSGMAMNHGSDVTGQNVVILNICKHRKDSKKAAMIQRWIAFCFEMHQKVYPRNRICMVFDMSGAGLSQMDMDLVRFIINCFKIYFPDLLEWLLVYNMPWVLQAAWKIIQSWLSDGAATKVKFVTAETIQEYIPVDNLLTKFGGNDPWEFIYEVERDVMLRLIRGVEERPQENNEAGPEFSEEEEEELEEEEEEEGVNEEVGGGAEVAGPGGSLKQVRFSSGLPPSRYGTDEDGPISPASLDQSMLRRGSATSNGFRKRQVSRLMSLQESPRSSVEEGGPNRSVNSLRKRTQPSELVVTVGDLILSPSHELVFSGKKDGSDVVSIVTLKNTSDNIVAYKIKTTAPLRYKVRPNLALIDPKSISKVQVVLTPGADIKTSQDKFLVQTHSFLDNTIVPKPTNLTSYWKSLPSSSFSEHRMRCRWLTEISSREAVTAVAKSSPVGSKAEPPKPLPPKTTVISSGETIEQKVQKLLVANTRLSNKMVSLQRLNYIIMCLLVLLMAVIYLY